jgi:hypothetical protein
LKEEEGKMNLLEMPGGPAGRRRKESAPVPGAAGCGVTKGALFFVPSEKIRPVKADEI